MWLRDIPAIIPILAAVYLLTVYLLLVLAQRVTASPTTTAQGVLPLVRTLMSKPTVPFSKDYGLKEDTTQSPSQKS